MSQIQKPSNQPNRDDQGSARDRQPVGGKDGRNNPSPVQETERGRSTAQGGGGKSTREFDGASRSTPRGTEDERAAGSAKSGCTPSTQNQWKQGAKSGNRVESDEDSTNISNPDSAAGQNTSDQRAY